MVEQLNLPGLEPPKNPEFPSALNAVRPDAVEVTSADIAQATEGAEDQINEYTARAREFGKLSAGGAKVIVDREVVESPHQPDKKVQEPVNRGGFVLTKTGEIDRRHLKVAEKRASEKLPEDQWNLR